MSLSDSSDDRGPVKPRSIFIEESDGRYDQNKSSSRTRRGGRGEFNVEGKCRRDDRGHHRSMPDVSEGHVQSSPRGGRDVSSQSTSRVGGGGRNIQGAAPDTLRRDPNNMAMSTLNKSSSRLYRVGGDVQHSAPDTMRRDTKSMSMSTLPTYNPLTASLKIICNKFLRELETLQSEHCDDPNSHDAAITQLKIQCCGIINLSVPPPRPHSDTIATNRSRLMVQGGTSLVPTHQRKRVDFDTTAQIERGNPSSMKRYASQSGLNEISSELKHGQESKPRGSSSQCGRQPEPPPHELTSSRTERFKRQVRATRSQSLAGAEMASAGHTLPDEGSSSMPERKRDTRQARPQSRAGRERTSADHTLPDEGSSSMPERKRDTRQARPQALAGREMTSADHTLPDEGSSSMPERKKDTRPARPQSGYKQGRTPAMPFGAGHPSFTSESDITKTVSEILNPKQPKVPSIPSTSGNRDNADTKTTQRVNTNKQKLHRAPVVPRILSASVDASDIQSTHTKRLNTKKSNLKATPTYSGMDQWTSRTATGRPGSLAPLPMAPRVPTVQDNPYLPDPDPTQRHRAVRPLPENNRRSYEERRKHYDQ